jgi:hypothetical protein
MAEFDFNSAEPFEVISAPLRAWLAPVGTAFPDVDEDPGVSWTLLGANGEKNITRDGVIVRQPQSISYFRSLGDTGPIKAFRTDEDLMFVLNLADFRIEAMSIVMNHNAITTVAAGATTAGKKRIGLSRGPGVEARALLVRGLFSASGAGMFCQWEVPKAVLDGNPEPQAQLGTPLIWALDFRAMVDLTATDPTERFGRFLEMTAAPTS